MNNILWIEDSSMHDLSHIAVPLWTDASYSLTIADDISTAEMHLNRREFQAVIFDLRLPPGIDPKWIKVKEKLSKRREAARLGIHLLLNLFGVPDRGMEVNVNKPAWLTRDRIGILSVDYYSEVQDSISRLGLDENIYRRKTTGMPRTALKTLVKKTLK